jgi:hypothetical protein
MQVVCIASRSVTLELDHAIRFVPSPDVDLPGFTVEPGRVHTGQGTRNVRVLFERNYLEVAWIEHPDQVAARGLDFLGRCARPATACPFGCVLRGSIPAPLRARFVPYPLPDAPGFVLQLLAEQPADAPFIAVFEMTDCEASWPLRRGGGHYLVHPNGAARLVRATLTAPAPAPIEGIADVAFAIGAPRLELDFGDFATAFVP